MQRIITVPLFVVLIVLLSWAGNAQTRRGASSGRIPPITSRFTAGDSARVPIEIDNNIIFLRVRVNGSRPLKFIFDTGASVSVVNSALIRELGLKPKGKVRGTATGGNIEVGLVGGVSLSVEGAEVANQIVATMSLAATPCVEFDGVIGYDFINQFVVEIDYDGKFINLHRPQTYVYSGNGKTVPLLLDGLRTPLVQANISVKGEPAISSRLELDTGGDSAFIVNSPFVKKHKLASLVSHTVGGSSVGAGGDSKIVIGRVKSIQVGPFTIENPTLSLAQDSEGSRGSNENDGIVGGEVLRRFKVILDYSRSRMLLEPTSSVSQPYEIGMTGLNFGSDQEDCKVQRIESVNPNSPATEAGLQPGDIITAIDGRSTGDIPSNELEQMFKQNGRELNLTIKRDSEILQKKLKLRRLI